MATKKARPAKGMGFHRSLTTALRSEATELYKKSVIPRFFSVRGRILIDDGVTPLCASPLGMFFYNQRAILYGLSGIYIVFLAILALYGHFPLQPSKVVVLLFSGWWAGVLFTIGRHSHFRRGLKKWADSPTSGELPEVFDIYFAADSVILLALFITGRVLKFPIDQLLFVLFANLLVYCTYIGGERQHRSVPLAAPLIMVIAVFTLGFPSEGAVQFSGPSLFTLAFLTGPFLTLVVVTPLSASMISWLRKIEHDVTKERLALFGTYGTALSDGSPSLLSQRSEASDAHSNTEDFRKRVRAVVTDLCDSAKGLGYSSGRIFILQFHKDKGQLLVPYTQTNVPSIEPIPNNGIIERFVKTGSALRYTNEHFLDGGDIDIDSALSSPPSSSAHAIVPLHLRNRPKGLLVLYGSKSGVASFPQEKVFLDSLGKMIASSMEEWDARFGLDAHGRISSLHSCETLDDLFDKAAKLLRECLNAAGCMIAYRPQLATRDLVIVAADGFRTAALPKNYPGPDSKTAQSALQGIPIRYDDVDAHRFEFDPKLIEQLEKSLGSRVQSWMAIPIGSREHSYGAIKVINNRSHCRWFTDDDEALATHLAVQLHTIIERFRYVEELKKAQEDITRSLELASAAKKKAEDVARQRQDDIMIMSHQLQGPLASNVATLSLMKQSLLIRDWRALQTGIDGVRETTEDALSLCYGIVTTFAQDAGNPNSLDEVEVDAPKELRLLAERLQKTNARSDLTFKFRAEDKFPRITIDKSIFTSVFYSLLHNAMKYADPHSTVTLECSQERSTGHFALKVKTVGEPIDPAEKEKIFDKYQRGAVIARTGRHHGGVGLGLWVARQLMTNVGGTIRVEVTPIDPRLSVFIVEL